MKASNVVEFHPQLVGDGYRFDTDAILEAAKGQGFVSVSIIAELPDVPLLKGVEVARAGYDIIGVALMGVAYLSLLAFGGLLASVIAGEGVKRRNKNYRRED